MSARIIGLFVAVLLAALTAMPGGCVHVERRSRTVVQEPPPAQQYVDPYHQRYTEPYPR